MVDPLSYMMTRDEDGKEDDCSSSFRLDKQANMSATRQPLGSGFRRASGFLPAAKSWIQQRAVSLRGLQHQHSQGSSSHGSSDPAFDSAEDEVMTEELWNELCAKVPSFHRNELQLSRFALVESTNTQAYVVTGIKLPALRTSSRNIMQPQLRQDLSDSVQAQQGGLYCVKVPHKKLARDKKALKRAVAELVTETKLLSTLLHPNLPVLRGVGHLQGDVFLLTDCVRATLPERIHEWRVSNNGQPPDEDETPMKVNYAFQLAKVLRFLHGRKILLCDLKPQSVGFAAHDPHTLVLMDLGRAKQTGLDLDDEVTPLEWHCKAVAGTRRYLAPEVLLNGHYSTLSDVYSWATVVYEMMAERKPYEGMTSLEHQELVCQQGCRESLNYYYFPEALDEVIARAWHPDLDQRWSLPKICEELQTFLLKVDPMFYNDQKPGDFLFDLVLDPQDDDAMSELGMEDHRIEARYHQMLHLDHVKKAEDWYGDSSNGVDLSSGLDNSSSAFVSDDPLRDSTEQSAGDLSSVTSAPACSHDKLSSSNSNHATTGNVVPRKIAPSAA